LQPEVKLEFVSIKDMLSNLQQTKYINVESGPCHVTLLTVIDIYLD